MIRECTADRAFKTLGQGVNTEITSKKLVEFSWTSKQSASIKLSLQIVMIAEIMNRGRTDKSGKRIYDEVSLISFEI